MLADGTQVDARAVLSNADPKRTFLRLVHSEDLPVEFIRAISRIRFESSSFKLNLALSELPDFRAVPGTTVQPHHKAIIDLAPSMDYLERAYDDAKRGRPSREPFLEFVIESANDPTVAPPGMHTLTISAKFAPFDLATGSWDTEARVFADRIVEVLEQYAPNIRRAVVAMHWRSPLTMEQEYGLTRGDVFHGAILPYQMFSFRPVPGWSSYRTPVRGLYLCGAGAHPGGGVMGAAGHNAARCAGRSSTPSHGWPRHPSRMHRSRRAAVPTLRCREAARPWTSGRAGPDRRTRRTPPTASLRSGRSGAARDRSQGNGLAARCRSDPPRWTSGFPGTFATRLGRSQTSCPRTGLPDGAPEDEPCRSVHPQGRMTRASSTIGSAT